MIKLLKTVRRSFAMANPYEVLGVTETASLEDVKKAFVKKTKELNFEVGSYSKVSQVDSKGTSQQNR